MCIFVTQNQTLSVMKQLLFVLTAILLATTAQAKKVKVTIDGMVSPSQTRLYLIINEDTANAQLIPIKDAKFSVTIKVDRDAFIRLHDYKQWPERSQFILIPDSKHITIDWDRGTIKGSEKSLELQIACRLIRDESPEGFHVDVFTDDPEAWREARLTEASIATQVDEASYPEEEKVTDRCKILLGMGFTKKHPKV